MTQKNGSRVLMLFVFAMTIMSFQLWRTEAQAQSSFFTSRGCVDCHGAPTAATCAGCHHHSGTLTATKNKTTSYAPGETVTITLTASGARTGWVGARLYSQTGAEIARSTGAQSGMGGSTTYPAVLSAPAPAAAGTYTWRIAYLGNEDGNGSGDVHSEKSANVSVVVAAAAPPADTTAPVVATFTLPATATSLTVPVSAFSATDNVAVTGYLINKVATAPTAAAAGWTATAPASVTAVAGSNTFYAWVKDAAGNVSLAKSAIVTVTLPDTTLPVVGTFTLPATATSLTVPVSAFSATDNVAVTGYLINTVATAPTSAAAGWTATAPASVTAVAGSNTFYAWVKDAAGNVSLAKSAIVTVTLPDTTLPVVGTFTLPATATSLTVPVSAFSATDNVAVTGYLINNIATAPTAAAAGWTATAPASVTAAAGSNTFYAWVKDAAGNVSLAKSAIVTVTLPDTTLPVVGTFTLPANATSLTVPVSAFSATDNVAVTGYLINTVATAPTAAAAGWTASAPASVTAVAGSNTFYAWVKDAAGNVSLAKSAIVTVTIVTADTTLPVVGTFTLPATATTLTVPVSAFTATDNVAVAGYLINKVATAPTAAAAGWTAAAPASVTAVAGSNTFYAWVKDAAGNVSLAKSAIVTVTLPDTTLPVVSTFTLPATATNLTVLVSAFTATDNVAVTGYLINKVATAPTAAAAGWTTTAPASVIAAAGSNTFYAWVKDAAGNVSLAKSAIVTVTIVTADTTLPVVGTFTLPAAATTLTVPVSAFTATDNVAVTGYLINKVATAPTAAAAGWAATAPASVTAVAGSNTFYAWVKDAAGNVSLAKSAAVTVTIASADTTKPTLTISALATGSYTNKTTLNISGNASDAGGLKSLTVNGEVVVVNADGSFSAALPLVTGANTITVIAADQAGNQQTDLRTINFDPAAPVLVVTAPGDNSSSAQSFITLTGTISETSTVTITDNNGSQHSAAITGSNFSATINLAAGVNTITITATDLAGNTASAKRTITYDSGTLTMAVTYPNQDITTRRDKVQLTGRILNAAGKVSVTVKVNGRTYTPAVIKGIFRQNISFREPGLYAITVTATDAAGNSSVVNRNVIYRDKERERERDDDHDDDDNRDHDDD